MESMAAESWADALASLPGAGRLFIDGRWRTSRDGGRRDVVAPATGRVVTTVAAAEAADVDDAVAAARRAVDCGIWAGLGVRGRAEVLRRVAGLVREHAEELARLEALDVGKPITLARHVDVPTVVAHYEYVAGLASHLDGSVRQTPLPVHAFTRREPVGVVAAITPFNFPLILSTTKIAPALLAGNTVVHKPAGETPLSALLMAELCHEAGVPDGVLNVITGHGARIGDHLVTHPGVDKVAFTGSTETGAHVAALAGAHLKPMTAELGGNAANLLFADADLDRVLGSVVSAFVYNTGQFCMAGPRLLVERSVHDRVLDLLGAAVPGVPVGDPWDPATVVGPLVSAAQLERVEELVDGARDAGADVVVGGDRMDLDGGYYYRPTVLAGVANDAAVVQQEVFGPVLTVQPFDTEDEAVALANSTPFGLAAGVQTGNPDRAHRVSARLAAGIVWVNGWSLLDPGVPFGGVRNSGWGRESGPECLDAYTATKSVVMSVAPPEPAEPPEPAGPAEPQGV
jgi:acyl-CoA reductase-like NAD-dependent aldehyde dehydrogenase